MKANILVYDVGSTYTKGAAFCLADGKLTVLARGKHPTTLESVGDGAGWAGGGRGWGRDFGYVLRIVIGIPEGLIQCL